MKTNKREQNNERQNVQSKTGNTQTNDPLKDGIRYDYTDSSDFKNNK